MQWNLRMKAAERGIWKSVEMRRLLAEAGLEISAGKMSMLWTTTPTTIRLEDLDVICTVLDCTPSDLLIVEPEAVAARRPQAAKTGNGDDQPASATSPASRVTPRLGRNRTLPPA
jgi:DNA-binding Xre family transcriptional regulator